MKGVHDEPKANAQLRGLVHELQGHADTYRRTFAQYIGHGPNWSAAEDQLGAVGVDLVRTTRAICAIPTQTDEGIRAKLEARSIMYSVHGDHLLVDAGDGSDGDIIALSILADLHARHDIPYPVASL